MPGPWPLPATRPPGRPRQPGCWITTCTPRRLPAGTSRPGRTPKTLRRRAGRRLAAGGLEVERANLHAAAGYAAATARPRYAVLIPAAMDGFLQAKGYWDQGLILHQAALVAGRPA